MLTDPENLRRLKDITFEEFRKIADKWASTKGEVDAFEDTGSSHVVFCYAIFDSCHVLGCACFEYNE